MSTSDPRNVYENPLITRYASREMAELWSSRRRIRTWRELWVALADTERSLGLPITAEQVHELRDKIDDIDFDAARAYEKRVRHDVMAHVHAYGDAAPSARGVIHLGATSCYVTDNADLILIREGMIMIRDQLANIIDALGHFAALWRSEACLGYTHFQPAQPVTVGKRATLWCWDLIMDLREAERRIEELPFLGVKGTTGTQASFLALFDGDHVRVETLEARIAEHFGFSHVAPVSGQTYARKWDSFILSTLSGIAESAHRFGCDLRLLSHEQELEEPFEEDQIGSSAMAYKRNPMRAERICSLARFALSLTPAAQQTAAQQWLERTLDDSAVRRLTIPQAFLAIDAILSLYQNIVRGFVVRPAVIARNLAEHLPFMATEELLMVATRAGGDRQELHERIRIHAHAATHQWKTVGEHDMLARLQSDPAFAAVDIPALLNPQRFIGRCPEQVDTFLRDYVDPVRARYPNRTTKGRDIDV